MKDKTMANDKPRSELAFASVLPIVEPRPKPRKTGLTELRDKAISLRQLQDIVEVMGDYVDSVKWTSGGQRLVSADLVRTKNSYLREHGIEVSSGGFLERVLLAGGSAPRRFLEEAKALGFTTIEVSSGSAILPLADKLDLIKAVIDAGLKAKPEVAMAYSPVGRNPEIPPANVDMIIYECEKCLEAGAWKITIEEDGVFRYVKEPAYDLVYKLVRTIGLDRLMFEASDNVTFNWLIRTFGCDVNIFVDPSDLMALTGLRTGIWGREDTWGRMAGFRTEMGQ
jgi:phosphosulfolactate synthase (CoM biosynthesis protein A)